MLTKGRLLELGLKWLATTGYSSGGQCALEATQCSARAVPEPPFLQIFEPALQRFKFPSGRQIVLAPFLDGLQVFKYIRGNEGPHKTLPLFFDDG